MSNAINNARQSWQLIYTFLSRVWWEYINKIVTLITPNNTLLVSNFEKIVENFIYFFKCIILI